MDLGSRLVNLSLAEIASMLNTKQQEVLLVSLSVAARFIQQLQAEEQQSQQQASQAPQLQPLSLQQQLESQLDLQQQQQQQPLNATNLPTPTAAHQQSFVGSQTATTTFGSTFDDDDLHHSGQDDHDELDDDDDHELDDDSQELSEDDDQQLSEGDHSSQFDDLTPNHLLSQQATKHIPNHNHHRHRNNNHHIHSNNNNHHHRHATNTTTTHGTEADRETLLTIREFAEELKERRKAIRLSQKGAAQSLRAFTDGAQPCTDAIIYHFENLQLEPDRAIQLIPLLRDWLEWAEKHRLSSKQLPMMSAVTKVPRERKRKVVLFNEKAKQHLEDAFLKNNHPDRYQLEVISKELGIPTRSIRKWFTNRRQRKRFAEKFSPII